MPDMLVTLLKSKHHVSEALAKKLAKAARANLNLPECKVLWSAELEHEALRLLPSMEEASKPKRVWTKWDMVDSDGFFISQRPSSGNRQPLEVQLFPTTTSGLIWDQNQPNIAISSTTSPHDELGYSQKEFPSSEKITLSASSSSSVAKDCDLMELSNLSTRSSKSYSMEVLSPRKKANQKVLSSSASSLEVPSPKKSPRLKAKLACETRDSDHSLPDEPMELSPRKSSSMHNKLRSATVNTPELPMELSPRKSSSLHNDLRPTFNSPEQRQTVSLRDSFKKSSSQKMMEQDSPETVEWLEFNPAAASKVLAVKRKSVATKLSSVIPENLQQLPPCYSTSETGRDSPKKSRTRTDRSVSPKVCLSQSYEAMLVTPARRASSPAKVRANSASPRPLRSASTSPRVSPATSPRVSPARPKRRSTTDCPRPESPGAKLKNGNVRKGRTATTVTPRRKRRSMSTPKEAQGGSSKCGEYYFFMPEDMRTRQTAKETMYVVPLPCIPEMEAAADGCSLASPLVTNMLPPLRTYSNSSVDSVHAIFQKPDMQCEETWSPKAWFEAVKELERPSFGEGVSSDNNNAPKLPLRQHSFDAGMIDRCQTKTDASIDRVPRHKSAPASLESTP